MDPKLFDPQIIIEIFRRNVSEHYYDMNGRVSRAEFWLFVLASFVVTLVAQIVGSVIGFGTLLGALVNLALLLPLTGLGARRLQDTGKPGSTVWIAILPIAISRICAVLLGLAGPFMWLGLFFLWPILTLVSLAALIAAIYVGWLCAQPGTPGPNQYGPVPPDPVASSTPAV
ncbi:MAG: DUF805 domain-containing protein [Alphaproteobacteria bacterium]|nr:DUF805 domain-containing protein [Alphaproteobacteria bacterium]